MANLFKPALARAAARGLRVVEGEASPKLRAQALRRSASSRVQPTFTDVGSGATFHGVEPGVEADTAAELARGAGARYSPKATAEQAMRAEALARHAGKPDFDPASLDVDRINAIMEGRPEPEVPPSVRNFAERQAKGAYSDLQPEDVADIMSRLRGAQSGQPARPGKRTPSFLLDAFEKQYGWRPQSEQHALDMLSPEALRELGFDPNL